MKPLTGKIKSVLKQYGFGIFSIVLNRALPEIFRYQNFILYKVDLQKGISGIPATDESVTVKKVRDPEEELFKQFRKKFPAQEFVSRIKRGKETAYIATKKGEIVAYAWVAEKELSIKAINHTYPLKDDEIFLYSCFVSRENRGEGIHSALIHERLRDYGRNSGYKTAYTGVLSVNRGSIRGIEKMGFKKYKRIGYLKIFSWEKWWGLENHDRPAEAPASITNGYKNRDKDLDKEPVDLNIPNT